MNPLFMIPSIFLIVEWDVVKQVPELPSQTAPTTDTPSRRSVPLFSSHSLLEIWGCLDSVPPVRYWQSTNDRFEYLHVPPDNVKSAIKSALWHRFCVSCTTRFLAIFFQAPCSPQPWVEEVNRYKKTGTKDRNIRESVRSSQIEYV